MFSAHRETARSTPLNKFNRAGIFVLMVFVICSKEVILILVYAFAKADEVTTLIQYATLIIPELR